MNERILELALQARQYAESKPDIYQVAYDKKFAELIVKECIKVSVPVLDEPYEDMSEFGKGLVEGQDVAIELIKKHFGVEE